MSFNDKIQKAGKESLRFILFYGLWLLPVVALCHWHWDLFYQHLFPTPANSGPKMVGAWPYSVSFLLLSLGWWALSWILYFISHLILPTLMLIFFKTQRERTPKRIIQIGERFRKMNLSSPQIFVLQETQALWRNRVWGFFFLPSPMGSLLLMDPTISTQLTADEYDIWISRQVVESKFFRTSAPGFLWWNILPTLSLLGGSVGASLAGALQADELNTSIVFAVAGFVAALFTWRTVRLQRAAAIDHKTMHAFHIPQEIFSGVMLKIDMLCPRSAWQPAWLRPSAEKRASVTENKIWFKGWIPTITGPGLWFATMCAVLVTMPPASLQQLSNYQAHAGTPTSMPLAQKPDPSAAVEKSAVAKTEPAAEKTTLAEEPTKPKQATEASVTLVETAPPSAVDTLMSQAITTGDMRGIIRAISRGEKLVDKDANHNGATPLLLALRKGDLEMVYLLLTLGSNLQTEIDNDGRDSLFYALEAPNRQQVVTYLMNAHLDFNHKAKDGLTAYDLAVKNGWTDVANLIAQIRERQGSANLPNQ